MRQTDVDALLSASWHFALVVVGVEVVWGNLDLEIWAGLQGPVGLGHAFGGAGESDQEPAIAGPGVGLTSELGELQGAVGPQECGFLVLEVLKGRGGGVVGRPGGVP